MTHGDELCQQGSQLGGDDVSQPQAGVRGHLVVPAAPRVQFGPGLADQLGQPPLVGRVDVFVRGPDRERAGLPLLQHLGGVAESEDV